MAAAATGSIRLQSVFVAEETWMARHDHRESQSAAPAIYWFPVCTKASAYDHSPDRICLLLNWPMPSLDRRERPQ
jgi:hypothetical protein